MRLQPFLAASLMLASVLTAHNAISGQLTATWSDNSGGVASTIVERRLPAELTFTPVADVPPGVTAYVDPAISDGVTYCYRVKAYDAYGESPYSDEACAVSMALPTGYGISVLKAGTGTGTVVSAPAGVRRFQRLELVPHKADLPQDGDRDTATCCCDVLLRRDAATSRRGRRPRRATSKPARASPRARASCDRSP